VPATLLARVEVVADLGVPEVLGRHVVVDDAAHLVR
jgi:hypothetical protein